MTPDAKLAAPQPHAPAESQDTAPGYAAAQAAGCSRVHWLTHETNADAMQLYDRIAEKSGFVQSRRIL